MATNRIVFTGGGSAGHVTPNLAIIAELDKKKWEIHYIGSEKGIEKELIAKIGIPYHGISSGKLRRYIDFENVKDIFRVMKGCYDAWKVLKKLKPRLVFSKGGFVSVPVVIAANLLKIPVFIHESDLTPGLANKIAQRFATKIFTSFEETVNYFPGKKAVAIGSPIRIEILNGSGVQGRKLLNFNEKKPILTIMGGSLGARKINEAVRGNLPWLTDRFQVVHLCGKGQMDTNLSGLPGYRQFEYVHEELPDLLAATDLVITRGGSNSIFEFLALGIPMLIIPLTLQQSRGDQILNAKTFHKNGFSLTLEEEGLNSESFKKAVDELQLKSQEIKMNMKKVNKQNAIDVLLGEIENY
ncbi:undecaprenyldiphospho-muramoylpentapeptide beta-N-acetylglucosaminyltransferase [Bacillus sp. B-jedd]|uniref:undecaprenyldiphospho-muramoylpentapeptide beta-N-acetylglucosaminyltransferase n=1 Tax=Bacillus sp. B-jedd TaxID=1476857 RepID=UPI00051561F9|nr:undecaprenyldiphospho-muramoylpentapeptide beta-N-acetylglucosaminyltransferase [Bacillus sp. B-jedd]CEG27070.1 undecaprenyldiphospho-muramoylpentapeptide beta-N-acetylglucosaminyltransferase [Bacillus sp. B-jedd]